MQNSEPIYPRALGRLGEQALVELVAVVGCFVAVSWLMNVAHTAAQASAGTPLPAWPA